MSSLIYLNSGESLQAQVERIVTGIMSDILSEHKERFDGFSQVTQVDVGRQILAFKEALVVKITQWFEKAGDGAVMGTNEVNDIVKQVVRELDLTI
jgi:hypothetical protein